MAGTDNNDVICVLWGVAGAADAADAADGAAAAERGGGRSAGLLLLLVVLQAAGTTAGMVRITCWNQTLSVRELLYTIMLATQHQSLVCLLLGTTTVV